MLQQSEDLGNWAAPFKIDDISALTPIVYDERDFRSELFESISVAICFRTPSTVIMNRFAFWVVSECPFENMIRQRNVHPIRLCGEPVTWSNFEASYDVAEREPSSRVDSTYVLEEYIVPSP